jgi:hypothetical protein
MKFAFAGLLSMMLCGISFQVNADPPGSSQSGNEKQAMKDCMARQKASNSSMTQAAMETVCKNEAKKGKLQKDGNDLATGPQAPKQH